MRSPGMDAGIKKTLAIPEKEQDNTILLKIKSFNGAKKK
jgi:hypothetical protein